MYRMAATTPLYAQPNSSEDSNAPRRGFMPSGAGRLPGAAVVTAAAAGVVTAAPSWMAERRRSYGRNLWMSPWQESAAYLP
jgi:hypothetical protein